MGVFLNVIVFPQQSRAAVQSALDRLAPSLVLQSQLDPAQFHWSQQERGTVLLLGDCCPYEQLPQELSRQLDGTAMLCYIYDDDFWGYELYDKGSWVDTFWTVPDYFQPVDPKLLCHAQEEHAQLLAQHFSVDPADIREYLVPWAREDLDGEGHLAYPGDASTRGDCWQLGDFLHRLGNWTDGVLAPDLDPNGIPLPPECSNLPASNTVPDSVWTPPPPRPEPVWEELDLGKCLPFLSSVRLICAPGQPVQERGTQDLDTPALEKLLERFYSGQLAQLELDFTLQGEGVYVKRLKKKVYQPSRLTLDLIQDGGRYLCVCFDDREFYVYWLIADQEVYLNQECDEHNMTSLSGRTIQEYLVHRSPQAIRRELPILLSHLHRKEEVFSCLSRMGVWGNEYHYRNQKKHQQLREVWCLSS